MAKGDKENRLLPVTLSDSEWDSKSEELAEVSLAIDELAEERKVALLVLRDRDDVLQSRRRNVAKHVHDKAEIRVVSCEWDVDEVAKEAILKREDTNEIVERRPLEDDELEELEKVK